MNTTPAFEARCCGCGKIQYFTAPNSPRGAMGLVGIAEAIGWKAELDPYYNRVLLFCSEECVKHELVKTGKHFKQKMSYGRTATSTPNKTGS